VRERAEMSGDGILSVRLPRSLLGAFRTATERQEITIHEGARRMIAVMSSVGRDEINSLQEPPCELDNPRVSLYVGWRGVDSLAAATRNSALTNSSIFRRLLYGLLVTRKVEFVQQDGQVKLKTVSEIKLKHEL
jgi:hypothetical protein